MSHTVTVTRTTTTTSTSAIIINTGYMKTLPGLLKLAEVIVAAVCLFLFAYYNYPIRAIPYQFFLSVITTALVASSCLLVACLISLSTSSIIAKTIYELVFHSVMFGLTLAASIVLFMEADRHSHYDYYHNKLLTCSILGLVLSVLYLISTVFAFRNYRGL